MYTRPNTHTHTKTPHTATIQLAYSWIFLPQTLPVSYVRFLNKHGGKDLAQYAAVRVCMWEDMGGCGGVYVRVCMWGMWGCMCNIYMMQSE